MSHQLLLRFCVALPLLLFTTLLAAQEDCSNGIDDDGDGLVDLDDTADCSCQRPSVVTSLLPNPSLENFYGGEAGCTSRQPGGLPDATNQANCLVGWQRVSYGTTDSWNAFTLPGAPPSFPSKLPQPLPSGTGVAGFWVGVRDRPGARFPNADGTTASNYREYLAACFEGGQRLQPGENYRLTFGLGFMEPQTFETSDGRGDVLLSSPGPVELSIYGVRECDQLSFGDFYGCPEEAGAAGYELIANVRVSGEAGTWTPATVDFIAQQDYAGFAIGGSCAEDIRAEGVRGYRNYYFIDDLILNTTSAFAATVAGPVSVEGQTICADEVILQGKAQPDAAYQWYQNGSALPGATDPTLVLTPSLSIDGGYRLRITTAAGCAVTEPVKIQRPIIYDRIADSVAMCTPGEEVTIYPGFQSGATYTWDDGSTGNSYTVSEPGTYAVTVSSACLQRVEQFVVTPDAEPSYSFRMTPARPCRGDTVSIQLVSNWSIPLMIYLLPDGELRYAEQGQAIQVIAGEVAGSIFAYMASSCGLLFDEVTVPDLPSLEVTAAVTDLNCEGPTGRIELGTTEAEEVNYRWTDPGGRQLSGSGSAVTAYQAGTYRVSIDAEGYCTTRQQYTLTDNDNFALSVHATDVTCGNDATAIALATGGVPPYRVDWHRDPDDPPVGSNQMAARDLDRGTWYAEVTDSNGCYAGASFTVQGPAPLRVSATAGYDSCHSPTAGLIEVSASGGTLPYSYARTTTTGSVSQLNSLFAGVTDGLHEVVATDAMGCTSHPYPVAVTLPATFELDAGADHHISWGESVVLDATLSGIDASEGTLRWSSTAAFSPLSNTYDPLRIKTTPPRSADYMVTFTSAEHCVRSDTVRVVVDTTARLYAPNAFSPNGDGSNDRFSFYTNAVVTGTVALSIYDRWGNLLWERPAEGVAEWDGTFNGAPVNSGVYVYSGTVRLRGGGTLPVRGSVLLLR